MSLVRNSLVRNLGLGQARWGVALAVALVHLGLLGLMVPSGRASGVAEPVSVMLEREAEPTPEPAAAAPEAASSAPETAVAEPLLPLVAAPEMMPLEAPPVVVPKSEARPKPLPKPPAVAKREPPKAAPVREKHRPEAARATQSPQRSAPVAREGRGQAEAAPRAARPGAGGNDAGYAARVRASLQARANALGFEDVNATVVLSFSIDASGRVASASVARPSGDFKVDGALRRMLASASFPPPPGGRFSGVVPVRIR